MLLRACCARSRSRGCCPAVQEGLVLQLLCLLALPAGQNVLLMCLSSVLSGFDLGSCTCRKQPGLVMMVRCAQLLLLR